MGEWHTSELGNAFATKFLLFSTSTGEKIKLRLYYRNSFAGLYPMAYAYKDSLWIVGYTISDDGAANMALGIPIDCIHPSSTVDQNMLFEDRTFSALEDLILDADKVLKDI